MGSPPKQERAQSSGMADESRIKSSFVPQQVRQGNSRKRKLQVLISQKPQAGNLAQPAATCSHDPPGPGDSMVSPRLAAQSAANEVQAPRTLELETARARLEQLKKKKEKINSQQGMSVLVHAPGDPTKSLRSSEDVQMALKRAREKLRGAMEKRDQAMQRLSPVSDNIAPISALSADLVIQNVAATGAEGKVFFPTTMLCADLGRSGLEQVKTPTDSIASGSLAARKLRLQKELQMLKEKLEKHQKDDDNDSASENIYNVAKQAYTKEELEKKKEEARMVMDISHWKLFISKQERMMEEATKGVIENRLALSACEKEQQQTNTQLEKTNQDLGGVENSEKAVLCLISSSTCKLLKTRKELHREKQKGTT